MPNRRTLAAWVGRLKARGRAWGSSSRTSRARAGRQPRPKRTRTFGFTSRTLPALSPRHVGPTHLHRRPHPGPPPRTTVSRTVPLHRPPGAQEYNLGSWRRCRRLSRTHAPFAKCVRTAPWARRPALVAERYRAGRPLGFACYRALYSTTSPTALSSRTAKSSSQHVCWTSVFARSTMQLSRDSYQALADGAQLLAALDVSTDGSHLLTDACCEAISGWPTCASSWTTATTI